MITIGIAQVGWVALARRRPLGRGDLRGGSPSWWLLELVGPFIAERKAGTPWHAHHIAERYGLLVIITLGEVILGTVASLNAIVHGESGWTIDAALLAIAGVGLTFGCWWMYSSVPWAEPLVRHRQRAFPFGYGHLADLRLARGDGRRPPRRRVRPGARSEDRNDRDGVLSVAIPVAIYVALFYALYSVVMRQRRPVPPRPDRGHRRGRPRLVRRARGGRNERDDLPASCLMFAPIVTVVGYKMLGHRHIADALERL